MALEWSGLLQDQPIKFFNQAISFDASIVVMYSDSQVESATVSYLELFQVTTPRLIKHLARLRIEVVSICLKVGVTISSHSQCLTITKD